MRFPVEASGIARRAGEMPPYHVPAGKRRRTSPYSFIQLPFRLNRTVRLSYRYGISFFILHHDAFQNRLSANSGIVSAFLFAHPTPPRGHMMPSFTATVPSGTFCNRVHENNGCHAPRVILMLNQSRTLFPNAPCPAIRRLAAVHATKVLMRQAAQVPAV